jgi:hypothetical protein
MQVAHDATAEMLAFHRYWAISPEHRHALNPEDVEFADMVERLSPSGRRRACAKFMRMAKKGIAR